MTRSQPRTTRAARYTRQGFTLLEILLAISLMALITVITFMTFGVVVGSWQKGTRLVERLHHGDFIMDQLVMGLRSSYFPDGAGTSTRYGMWLEDEGDGEDSNSSDILCWVKLGSSLVGKSAAFEGTPHRVTFYVTENEDGEPSAAVKAWRLEGQPEDFDPEEDVEPVFLSHQVVGFNCRTISPEDIDEEDGEFEWQDEWEYTNDLPLAVELTVYVTPVEKDGDPIPIQRILKIPVAYLCEPWTKTGEGDVEP